MAEHGRIIPLVMVLALAVLALVFWRSMPPPDRNAGPPAGEKAAPDSGPGDNAVEDGSPVPEGSSSVKPENPMLSVLGAPPDWSLLAAWHGTMTRDDFERLLTEVFTTGERWREFIRIGEKAAAIDTGQGSWFVLRFAGDEEAADLPLRSWRTPGEMEDAPEDLPLEGMHIAIDPGHIGGEWARMEERWLQVADQPPVKEGDMTLAVALLLKPRLEALGARVSLVRTKNEPITPLRPEVLQEIAVSQPGASAVADPAKLAQLLFYRTAEIRARADLVNHTLKPDLVLCLHFNAEPWGDPVAPTLVERTHFHLLLNGGYTDDEVALADQRFAMLSKLLGGTHAEEVAVGSTVARVFAERTGLPPYTYPSDAPTVRPIDGQPFLWARNLLANRLYECPVIFFEPYVMNSTLDHPRLVAGDYEGLREINGKQVPSVFREYADAVTEGLREHYAALR